MNEEAQKKLFMWILIGLAIAGVLFVLWAMFLNRGTLTIVASAPFTINIQGVRTESCSQSPCSTVLAPGDYAITIQKIGYRTVERSVSIPIGGEQREEVTFSFIPVIANRGSEAELRLFEEPDIELPELEETTLFFEENYVTYLAFDPETKRQTLFIRGMIDEGLGEPRVATSFIRTIQDYTIVSNIEKENSIALIDRSGDESALYLIDLTEKSRTNILTLPSIEGVKWIPDAGRLLLEGAAEDDLTASIHVFNIETQERKKLDLKTSIENVEALSQNRLIAATSQLFVGGAARDDLGGQLITLQEVAATPNVIAGLPGTQLSFVEYDLLTNQARLIAMEPSLSGAEKIRLKPDGKSLLFLSGGQVYELTFAE